MFKLPSRNLSSIGFKTLTVQNIARVNRCSARTLITPSIRLLQAQASDNAGKKMTIDCELPDPTKGKRRQQLALGGFIVAIAASLAIIFNYEKTESPIVTHTFYYLRRSPKSKELLGENIAFAGIVPWVYGELNQVAGNINISFYVKGDKNIPGEVKLVADRKNRNEEFLIHEWSLTADGKTINLLSDSGTSSI
ncbi:hypothetical protein TBLA_0E01790 [Henningerozyma blattae CBS 6284]|uniref:Uncharacterized protein n=1 Tax=Henningerozyma blattae (strain ATCC 34711 / CBS 6284 / DSM 70876 / NBRC 10599 / NRRL Y-10934 / UCD 77-7) TaxID=1071380 RepID=I2H4D2_HENB6|nr:hypothetical protein TBLA_0E01790 [Tetrapisispora blattae CBS 6284]CCH61234.1 hypothetical protein TBLA_0E01790 [Tetrapisispora blattae CBS 6284]